MNLRRSDSGPYRCGSGSGLVQQVEVVVVDAALLDGNPSTVRSLHVRSGGTLLVSCFFHSALAGDRKYFRGDEGLLVSTSGSSAQAGRYSIRYVGAIEGGGFVYVSITQLIRSDSGRYGCGLDKRFSEDPYQQFEVIVTDAQTTPEPGQTEPLFPSSDPPEPSEPPESTKRSGWSTRDVLLFVGVALVVMVTSSLCALMLYRKRTSKPKEPPEETQYADITETSRVYEDIMEDRPVDLSSIYTYITYSGAGGAGTDDDYSFITAAAASSSQNTDGLFSQVNFSNMAAVSSSSDQRGDEEEIIFNSAPLVERSSEEEPPLYSTVSRVE